MKHTKSRMNPAAVLKIYKTMLDEPKKVWVRTDFSGVYRKETGWVLNNSMNLLIQLGLVEPVIAVYYCGSNLSQKRNTQGFRLRNQNKK